MSFWPPQWTFTWLVKHALAEIITNQHRILVNQEKEMAALDNAKAALAKLGTDVQTLISKPNGVAESEVQALADTVNAIDQQVQNAIGPAPTA